MTPDKRVEEFAKELSAKVLEKIREVCEDKSKFTKPTHGTCCTCQRCGGDIDFCDCLSLCDIELKHLLLALGGDYVTDTFNNLIGMGYSIQKSVEDNLHSNLELTKWVYGVIIGKE